MISNRPKIKVPFQSIDIVFECISITLIVLMWLYLLTEYPNLPDTVASHFNANGEPNDYGSKTFILILPAVATLMYLVFFNVNRYPHLHNYFINITEENALKNYRFSTRIVRIAGMLTLILLAYITFQIVNGAKQETFSLGNWFLPVVIGTSVLLPIFVIIYFRMINKT